MNIQTINTVNRSDLTNNSTPGSSPLAAPIGIPSGEDKIQTAQKVSPLKKSEETKDNKEQIEAADAKEMVEALNEYMDVLQTNLGFSIREDLDHHPVVVEIKNRQTNELVKQIPSEELLAIMEKMKELNGIIFDQSV